jgi:hypothetical protein
MHQARQCYCPKQSSAIEVSVDMLTRQVGTDQIQVRIPSRSLGMNGCQLRFHSMEAEVTVRGLVMCLSIPSHCIKLRYCWQPSLKMETISCGER